MADHDLWVTERCARDDLGLDTWPDPEGVYGVDHTTVQKFRERLREEPEAGQFNNDLSRALGRPCFELKDDRLRGLTWFDADNEVVFLLFVGFHESGSRDDVYQRVLQVHRSKGVLPTDEDRAELQQWRAGRYLRELRDVAGPELLKATVAEPGVPCSRDIGQCDVVLVLEPYEREIWFAQLMLDSSDGRGPIGLPQAAEIATRLLGPGAQISEGSSWYGVGIAWNQHVFYAWISV